MGAYTDSGKIQSTEVVNVDQASAWDGHEGDVWTDHADRYDRASARTWRRFMEGLPLDREDRVLDVGCGTGGSTRDVARLVAPGEVMGLDLSTKMLELADKRAADEGLSNVTFVRGDAQVFPFEPETYDVAISCFGTMFFNDPIAAFTNMGGGLRQSGRLALLAWRTLQENDWLMSMRGALAMGRDLPMPPPDAPTPFSLADPDRVRGILGSAGFHDVEVEAIDEPIDFGADASDALEFARTMGIVEGLTDGLDAATKADAMSNLSRLFEEKESAEGVLIPSAAWRITARKP